MRMVIAAALTAMVVGDAVADSAAADVEIKQAEALAQRGDFVAAATHYKLAYAADARPELICNAGVAYYKAKDATRAHLYLSRCQERGTALDAQFVSAVRTALAAVESMLRGGEFTPVDIVAKPEGATIVVSSLGDTDAFVGSRLVWLASGKHTFRVRAEGYADKIVEVDARGRERQPVEVTLERAQQPPPDSGTQTIDAKPIVVTPPPATGEMVAPSKAPAMIATGATVLAASLAIVAYGIAHDRADRAEFAVSNDQYFADVETIDTWNTTFGAATALAVVGAGVSGYLWYRAFKTPAHVEVDASGAIAISGRW